jgi:hypothetical protein
VIKDTAAFKKIQSVSKLADNNISLDTAENNSLFRKVNNLYLNTNGANNNSYFYGTARQHNFSSTKATLPAYSTLVDKKSLTKFFDYTLNDSNAASNAHPTSQWTKPISTSILNRTPAEIASYQPLTFNHILNNADLVNAEKGDNRLAFSLIDFEKAKTLNVINDKQNLTNPLKAFDTSKKNSSEYSTSLFYLDDLIATTQNNFYS